MMLTIYYSHDYPDDTKMIVETREDGCIQLTLEFTSEDPDMGTETLIYAGNNSDWTELSRELQEEITNYLDIADTSSRCVQQYMFGEADDYYGEYSKTALYAFEAMLIHVNGDSES